ncbi:spindle and centriole-associated protein 1 [Scophthalmus maximus]|uniref:spindle and centriole-associated protein 1 n=1 Tax=Scophthalmus maximus TaxID=52904 RepID=UPI001FA8F374|nr:spindle and centriole-associated protein 1 [Scophthalmus maximus]XP_047185901.1 spindle and centriole-associated protein 1 [Scophthalmus maximus]XP_047185902.1 spindle and centriole-associated protein 1 [Scophthalmus maximus]
MSFVRVGRPLQHNKGKRLVRPKKAAAPKREWVSTVHDLSVHKLTPAELDHRHEIHQSHNKAAAQWDLREKALNRRLKHNGSPAPLDQASLNIIREVLSDQLLLKDVLARSDRAMAVVKDLFGDAPRRQTGHPSVTMAPHCDSDSELPVLQRPDPPTQLSLLSQSMMDQQALNELHDSEDGHSDEDAYPSGSSQYHVIQRANVRKMKALSRGGVIQKQKLCRPVSDHGDRYGVPVTPCTSGREPDQTALNATVAVQRVRTRQSQPEEAKEEQSVLVAQVLNPDVPFNQSGRINGRTGRTRKCISQSSELSASSVASLSGDQSSLGLLQAMLGQVEADLDTLSPDTAPGSAQSPKRHRTQGLTGFSVALISTLGRFVHHLKQMDERVQKEAEERKNMEEELREQRGLIDALTAETMALREEAAALQAGLQQRTAELEQKMDAVLLLIGGLGLLEPHTHPPQASDVKAAVFESAPVPERIQASVSPAVLLSPPRQRDNWQHIPVTLPVPSHQQLLPIDNIRSREDIQASSSSLASLPLTSLPSTSSLSLTSSDPLSSKLPAEALLAEIAQLSRQNELIKAQLSQAKILWSGVGASPDCGSEQRSRSSSGSGRFTPQSFGETRTSGSSSTRRQSQNIQVTDGLKVTHQTTSPNALSVEQRLLELNRQSAAARGRLLDLIEQQKNNVSSKVSPSASPIPTSAFSPHAAGGGSPEVSMLLPSKEFLSHADGGGRRSAGSEVSSHRSEGEAKDGKTQVEKQREREGWFALSAHMR